MKDDANDCEGQSNSSSQTDLSDVGLCSLNVHECSYNIILCLILIQDYKEAIANLNDLLNSVPKKYGK